MLRGLDSPIFEPLCVSLWRICPNFPMRNGSDDLWMHWQDPPFKANHGLKEGLQTSSGCGHQKIKTKVLGTVFQTQYDKTKTRISPVEPISLRMLLEARLRSVRIQHAPNCDCNVVSPVPPPLILKGNQLLSVPENPPLSVGSATMST